MFTRISHRGFALPTVLIASFVMLSVLTVLLSTVVTGVVATLDSSHYDKYAKEAAQSGLVMAEACLKANDYIPTWTNASKPLTPQTDCVGTTQSGYSAYLHNDTNENVRSTFTVAPPQDLANGVQRLTVVGTTQRLTESTGAVWRTYTESTYVTITAQASFDNVAFGYAGTSGAFFGVIDPLGSVTAVGYNGNGQLGNGGTSDTLTPTGYIGFQPAVGSLPAGPYRATKLFTNFLSVGYDMFAITSDGQLYGAGLNSSGQLGNNATTSAQTTPVKFQLPAGVTAKYVAQGQNMTYVIGSDNNIYSAGACADGVLGSGYTIAGCSDKHTYQRVALPAVNGSDLNTLPVLTSDWVQSTNLATDRANAYVRMQGGRVYGWGLNDFGQLGTSNLTSSSTPVQFANFGNSGQPKATQVAYDGDTFYALGDDGNVWASGYNQYGQLGAASPINSNNGMCIDDPYSFYSTTGGAIAQVWGCPAAGTYNSNEQMEWGDDGSLRIRIDDTHVMCLDNSNSNNVNNNPVQFWPCNGTGAQKWAYDDSGKIVNINGGGINNRCLTNPGSSTTSGTQLVIYDCQPAGDTSQTWNLGSQIVPQKVVIPAGHGGVARITTDQWTVLYLMNDGTIWGYGLNSAGQLGDGETKYDNPRIKQFIVPSGRTATNFYTTKQGVDSALQYGNTFAILDDGSVYGSGANTYGQLGYGSTSSTPVVTPRKMTLPTGIKAQTVQTGLGTTVVLTQDGKIYTVGNNSNGQLGDGTTNNSSTPDAREYVNNRPVVLY